MKKITDIRGREIIDSRGNPTVEAEVAAGGVTGRASVPSGASTGSLEAAELRDGDKKRFHGRGVRNAVTNVNTEIRDALVGMAVQEQRALDDAMIELDGTENKSRLGANAILAVSLAAAKAGAAIEGVPLHRHLAAGSVPLLPVPMINILNGGSHASNNVDIQEFMIVPLGGGDVRETIRIGAEIFYSLNRVLDKRGFSTTVGDEGGVAPDLESNEAAIEMILEAVEVSGYRPGEDIFLALDVASSELFDGGFYRLPSEKRHYDSAAFIECLAEWAGKYPIISIEDGMAEDDWDGWRAMTRKLDDKIQLVGDDLFVTNTEIIKKGIEMGVANSVLIKPNQIGTLSETLAAVELAQNAGYNCVMSHRSGETEDVSIADLAVATGVGQIKTGSLCRTDRVAKYNQLIRIEEGLGRDAGFAGRAVFERFLSPPQA